MTATLDILRYTKDTGNVSAVTVPVLVAVPTGSRLIVGVNCPVTAAVTTFTVTDSQGNSYTTRATQNTAPVNYQMAMASAFMTAGLTTSDTVTITVAGASPAKWCVNAISVDNSTGFDVAATASNTSTLPDSGTSAAAAQSSEIVFGMVGFTDTGGTTTFTPAGGFTMAAKLTSSPASAPRSLQMGYAYVSVPGGRRFNGTLSSSQAWGAIAGGYKASSAVNYGRYVRNSSGTWVPATTFRLQAGSWV